MNDVDRRDVWAQLTRISLITLPALLVFMVGGFNSQAHASPGWTRLAVTSFTRCLPWPR
ncbi:MAG: hypothetical protein ABF356_01840 [Polycyclovorans sp.]